MGIEHANDPSLERHTQAAATSDASTTFDEKPSHQASLDSLHSASTSVANRDQEKGQHVTEATDEERAAGLVTTLEPVSDGPVWTI